MRLFGVTYYYNTCTHHCRRFLPFHWLMIASYIRLHSLNNLSRAATVRCTLDRPMRSKDCENKSLFALSRIYYSSVVRKINLPLTLLIYEQNIMYNVVRRDGNWLFACLSIKKKYRWLIYKLSTSTNLSRAPFPQSSLTVLPSLSLSLSFSVPSILTLSHSLSFHQCCSTFFIFHKYMPYIVCLLTSTKRCRPIKTCLHITKRYIIL